LRCWTACVLTSEFRVVDASPRFLVCADSVALPINILQQHGGVQLRSVVFDNTICHFCIARAGCDVRACTYLWVVQFFTVIDRVLDPVVKGEVEFFGDNTSTFGSTSVRKHQKATPDAAVDHIEGHVCVCILQYARTYVCI
jgi:hypothetical protein